MASADVYLHVYDLSQGMARQLSRGILGKQIDLIPHTGVVIRNKEYFYGGGIQCLPPQTVVSNYGLMPIEMLKLGTTTKSDSEIATFLRSFVLGISIPDRITSIPREVLSTPLGGMIGEMMSSMQRQMGNGMANDPFSALAAGNGNSVPESFLGSGSTFSSPALSNPATLSTLATQFNETPITPIRFDSLESLPSSVELLLGLQNEKSVDFSADESTILRALPNILRSPKDVSSPDFSEAVGKIVKHALLSSDPAVLAPTLDILRAVSCYDVLLFEVISAVGASSLANALVSLPRAAAEPLSGLAPTSGGAPVDSLISAVSLNLALVCNVVSSACGRLLLSRTVVTGSFFDPVPGSENSAVQGRSFFEELVDLASAFTSAPPRVRTVAHALVLDLAVAMSPSSMHPEQCTVVRASTYTSKPLYGSSFGEKNAPEDEDMELDLLRARILSYDSEPLLPWECFHRNDSQSSSALGEKEVMVDDLLMHLSFSASNNIHEEQDSTSLWRRLLACCVLTRLSDAAQTSPTSKDMEKLNSYGIVISQMLRELEFEDMLGALARSRGGKNPLFDAALEALTFNIANA